MTEQHWERFNRTKHLFPGTAVQPPKPRDILSQFQRKKGSVYPSLSSLCRLILVGRAEIEIFTHFYLGPPLEREGERKERKHIHDRVTDSNKKVFLLSLSRSTFEVGAH